MRYICKLNPDPASAPNSPIRIVTIIKSSKPEVVRLENTSANTINLTGWKMCSIRGNQEHDGISGSLAPGEVKDFPYTGSGYIWNNDFQDDGVIYNANGQIMSYWIDN